MDLLKVLADAAHYADGGYGAEVQYYNPNTGTQSSYTLKLAITDGEVVKINFPRRPF